MPSPPPTPIPLPKDLWPPLAPAPAPPLPSPRRRGALKASLPPPPSNRTSTLSAIAWHRRSFFAWSAAGGEAPAAPPPPAGEFRNDGWLFAGCFFALAFAPALSGLVDPVSAPLDKVSRSVPSTDGESDLGAAVAVGAAGAEVSEGCRVSLSHLLLRSWPSSCAAAGLWEVVEVLGPSGGLSAEK